jgi:hypothetical protein
MADYLTTDTELASVASAIRSKGGTSSPLVYPTGFVSAINAIPTGGGGIKYAKFDVTASDTFTWADGDTLSTIEVMNKSVFQGVVTIDFSGNEVTAYLSSGAAGEGYLTLAIPDPDYGLSSIQYILGYSNGVLTIDDVGMLDGYLYAFVVG